jgi:glycosyltransferase involved in cell wall biosynthesis
LKLLQEFQALANERDLEVSAFVGNHGRHDAETVLPGKGFAQVRTPAVDQYLAWRIWGLPWAARRAGCDVIFAPHTQVIPPMSALPVVVTIHDTTQVRTPWQMNHKLRAASRTFLWCAAHYSARIIADSENSKRDLVEIYGLDPAKIRVTYLGYDKHVFNAEPPASDLLIPLQERFDIRRPYLFHHGTIQPRKNLVALIRAHRLLLEKNPGLELDLVLSGPLGWLYEPVVEEAEKAPMSRGRVIFTKALKDYELALLLKGATICVLPTFYEGFCLPMVEAMACGVPTVTSNSSCLPEVSGGVLKYFDPNSVEEMADVISLALFDSSERERLSQEGISRAASFSWRQTASQTLEILAEACNQRV